MSYELGEEGEDDQRVLIKRQLESSLQSGQRDDGLSHDVEPAEYADSSIQSGRPRSPVSSVVSMKSDKSMDLMPNFSGDVQQYTKIHLDRPTKSQSSALDSEDDLQNFSVTSEMKDWSEEMLCAVCPKRAAKFCLTCVENFCEVDVRQHYTEPELQRHNLVDVSTPLEQHLCDLHDRALEFFCQTDQISICAVCVVSDHLQHDVVQLSGHKSVQRKKSQIPSNKDIPPPGQVRIAAVTPDSVTLKWVNPEGQSGQPRFRVFWRCRLDNQRRFIDVKSTGVQIERLISGEKYDFKVATFSKDGGQSLGVSITASTEVPPPKNLTVETKVASMSVKWKKPTGVGEVSYLLTLSRDEDSQPLYTDLEEHIFTRLKLDVEYTISVLTALNNGAQSKPVSKVIRTCIPIPVNLEVGSVTATSASLSWSMPSEMDEIPHSFLVSCHSKGAEPQTITTESCSADITGLTPDTEHTVSVFTKLQEGGQGQRAITSIQTGIPPPGRVRFSSVQSDAVTLCWEPPEGLEGPYRYKVTWTPPGGAMRSRKVSTNKFQAQSLAPGEMYVFTVTTVCDANRESPHVDATVQTEIPVPKDVVIESDITSLSVKWTKPDGLDEVSYQLTLSRNEECETISTESLEHCFKDLLPGTKYSVGVSTALNDGQSKYVLNTTCTSIPAPEKLVVDSLTPTSASISWSVPSVMDQTPHRFLISYHSEGVEPKDITTDACSKVITDLKPGIQYKVSVLIVCEGAGNSEPASTSINLDRSFNHVETAQMVHTLDTTAPHPWPPPPPPGPIQFTSITSDSISFVWGPAEGHFKYRVICKGEGAQGIEYTEDLRTTVPFLLPGHKYDFTVVTIAEDGQSSECVSACAYTEVPVPLNVKVEINDNSAEVIWSKPKEVTQPTYVVSLSELYREDQRCLRTISTTSTQHCFPDLKPGVNYAIGVAVALKNGFQCKVVTRPISTVSGPEDLIVYSVTATSAKLKWQSNKECQVLQPPPRFLISYHSDENAHGTIDAHSCNTTISRLCPGSLYTVDVFTVFHHGRKSLPSSTTFRTPVPRPENPTVDSVSTTSAMIKWLPPHELGGTNPSYKVQVEGVQAMTAIACNIDILNLKPNTTYTVYVCTVLNDQQSEAVPVRVKTGSLTAKATSWFGL